MKFTHIALAALLGSSACIPPAAAWSLFPERPAPIHKRHKHHRHVMKAVAPGGKLRAALGVCVTDPGTLTTVPLDLRRILVNLCGSAGGAPIGGEGINVNGGTISLADPTVTTIGGVKSHAAVAGQFLTAIGTDGTPAAAALPAPTATALGGVKDHVAVTGFYITGIDATGTPTVSTTAGVTCPAGVPTATFTVTNGIVTAC